MLTPTPTPMTPNFNCNSPPFLIKIKRRAKNGIEKKAHDYLSCGSYLTTEVFGIQCPCAGSLRASDPYLRHVIGRDQSHA